MTELSNAPHRRNSSLPRTGSRIAAAAFVAMLVAGSPASAWAQIQRADLVCGEAASDRGIQDADLPDISAPSALVVTDDGQVLYARSASEQREIASITKIMTAIVALENAPLDTVVTVDEAAATVGESSAGLREGETLTLEDALRGLMVPSGNDAAMAIASTLGPLLDPSTADPLATFVDAMNAKAAELGMADTLFTNPHGLDFDDWEGDLHSTASDVALMVAYAMRNDTFRSIVGSGATSIQVTSADGTPRTVELREANLLLGVEGNIGVKTGTTEDAGACFAGAFDRDGNEIYTVVLGDPMTSGAESWADDTRFVDTMTLADWYYDHTENVPAVTSSRTTLAGEQLVARATHTDWSDKSVDVIAADPAATASLFTLGDEAQMTCDLASFSGDVHVGDPAGTLTITQDGQTVSEVELVSAEDVAAPNPVEWVLVQLDRLVRTLTGEPTAALEEVFATAPEV